MKQKIEAPNYTQIPNVLVDEYMKTLNGSEYKIIIAIARKTFGWHKEYDRISYSQISEITGISSKETINKALKILLEKNYIIAIKNNQSISYAINITENEPVQKMNRYENCTSTGTKTVPVEPKTGTETVHTKESNINKVKKNIGINKTTDKPDTVSQEVWDEYVSLRKQKRTTVTPLVVKGIEREAEKAGISLEQALTTCIERGWQGFKADWVKPTGYDGKGGKPAFRIASDNVTLKDGEINF